ncbi:hypothetical protein F750_6842 [Streptomyces sp. PAMC 26508]|nr:hypothetical protein F750_6842 [Streptomyces sp. PAMC 26508]
MTAVPQDSMALSWRVAIPRPHSKRFEHRPHAVREAFTG